MLGVPAFHFAFGWCDINFVIIFVLQAGLLHKSLLIAEEYGTDSAQSRPYHADIFLFLIGIIGIDLQGNRTWADDAHIAFDDIEELRNFVEFCFAEESSEWQNPWVML